jgi:hypothetical protein
MLNPGIKPQWKWKVPGEYGQAAARNEKGSKRMAQVCAACLLPGAE